MGRIVSNTAQPGGDEGERAAGAAPAKREQEEKGPREADQGRRAIADFGVIVLAEGSVNYCWRADFSHAGRLPEKMKMREVYDSAPVLSGRCFSKRSNFACSAR